MPKRPTGGKAKPGMTFATRKHRRDVELTNCVNETGADCRAVSTTHADLGSNGHALAAGGRRRSPCASEVLRNRMREIFTYGSVGGAGGNPGSYPEADADKPRR
jgi:hypothetical protein